MAAGTAAASPRRSRARGGGDDASSPSSASAPTRPLFLDDTPLSLLAIYEDDVAATAAGGGCTRSDGSRTIATKRPLFGPLASDAVGAAASPTCCCCGRAPSTPIPCSCSRTRAKADRAGLMGGKRVSGWMTLLTTALEPVVVPSRPAVFAESLPLVAEAMEGSPPFPPFATWPKCCDPSTHPSRVLITDAIARCSTVAFKPALEVRAGPGW